MPRLTAVFDVEIPEPLLIKRPTPDKLEFQARIDDFSAKVVLIPDEGLSSTEKGEALSSLVVRNIQVHVQRDEPGELPEVLIHGDGTRDYTLRAPFFHALLPQYATAARELVGRVLLFFKYRLRNPLIEPFRIRSAEFDNPRWLNAEGQEIEPGLALFTVGVTPGLSQYPFGAEKLTPDKDSDLQTALERPVVPALHEEFLSDAQAAIFEGNLRRAVLELAIACEIVVKHKLFGESSISGSAYEYLEDRGSIRTKVIELIDGVAKYTFGQSFKEFDSQSYSHIDQLFRCRNKVAHRGTLGFRDDKGNWQNVDRKTTELWWGAVERLLGWLAALPATIPAGG